MVKKVWQTDGRTDRRTENTICRAAWSQLKIEARHMFNKLWCWYSTTSESLTWAVCYICYICYIYLLLLISMLWHRQAICESKGDKLSSSAECRIRTQRVSETQSPADWMPADKPTELSRIKLKTWTRQPVPMISKHSAHLTPLPFGIRTWLWRYTYLLLLISMLWHSGRYELGCDAPMFQRPSGFESCIQQRKTTCLLSIRLPVPEHRN